MNDQAPLSSYEPDGDPLAINTSETAQYLKLIANERRLMILCLLAAKGEATVSFLSQSVSLGQSAMSQHLARLRADNLVDFRKEGQMAFYRIADERIEALLLRLGEIFC
ncbi:MAG: helix-turn-helix transcriptional regulator [Devosiaceae bacterium]|nr:helix-turn-helix transcriptional regulator [Devosiaceae bacterium MH13]